MKKESSGQVVFNLLGKLCEPNKVIHVGAGSGTGLLHQWRQWPIKDAVLVDADCDRLDWVESKAEGSQWQIVDALIGNGDDKQIFFQASNPDENGLIHPDQLKSIWPNLQCIEQTEREIKRLDQIVPLEESESRSWLLVDCFPALDILKGAETTLNRCGVLAVRGLKDTLETMPADACLSRINEYLITKGFRLLHIEDNNHPLTAHGFFVRDWYSQLEQVRIELNELGKVKAAVTSDRDAKAKALEEAIHSRDALAAEKGNLIKEREAQAKLASERLAKIEGLEKDNASISSDRDAKAKALEAAIHSRDALASEKSNLIKEKEAQAKLSSERLAEIEGLEKDNASISSDRAAKAKALEEAIHSGDALASEKSNLIKEREAQAKLASERLAEIEGLEKDNASISSDRDAKAKALKEAIHSRDALASEKSNLIKEKKAQTKLANDRKKQIEILNNKNNSFEQDIKAIKKENENVILNKQQLLKDEMVKAEAQIELIKDLLFIDQGI